MKENSMRILVTGGSGFIGTNYMDSLVQKDIEAFINIDFKAPRNPEHNKYWRDCNILDKSKFEKIVKDFAPTHIVHLAATCGLGKNMDDFAANTEGVENLMCILNGVPSVKHAIFTSSLLVCEPGYIPKHDTDYKPYTVYGESKMLGEKIVRSRENLAYTWTIIRPISIWGPWIVEPFTNFFKLISKGLYFHIGSGHCLRTFGYVENTVFQMQKILLRSLENSTNETVYVSDNIPVDLCDFASEAGRAINGKKIKHMPLIIVRMVAKIGDFLKMVGWKNVPLTSFRLKNMQTELVYTDLLEPIAKISGPLLYDYKAAVDRTVKWLKKEKII
ncbi:MAG: NAD(P)-dependent oxidoreductase [Candidatus Aceula meridiana]|nr:NAD(P)-dependent oxidoreductase [Candidatus Aceula meridiana]